MNERLQPWLARYAQSHRNPANKHLHQLCVPLILFAAIGLLRATALPGAGFNLALPAIVLALVYYLWLSPTRAIGMAVLLIAFYLLADASLRRFGTGMHLALMLTIFILAWIGQFVGHHIEGRRPSFADDLRFLLIGPIWVIEPLYPAHKNRAPENRV